MGQKKDILNFHDIKLRGIGKMSRNKYQFDSYRYNGLKISRKLVQELNYSLIVLAI